MNATSQGESSPRNTPDYLIDAQFDVSVFAMNRVTAEQTSRQKRIEALLRELWAEASAVSESEYAAVEVRMSGYEDPQIHFSIHLGGIPQSASFARFEDCLASEVAWQEKRKGPAGEMQQAMMDVYSKHIPYSEWPLKITRFYEEAAA